jgi:hypothetical protein
MSDIPVIKKLQQQYSDHYDGQLQFRLYSLKAVGGGICFALSDWKGARPQFFQMLYGHSSTDSSIHYDIIEHCGAPLSTVNTVNTDEASDTTSDPVECDSESDQYESCTDSVLDQPVHADVSETCVHPVLKQIVVTTPEPVQMEGQTNEIDLDSIAHNMIVTADILKEAHKWTDN